MQKKISVVIPNYNHSQYIIDRISSFVDQKYKPHEIIVIDDFSSDDSRKILTNLKKNIPFLKIILNDTNLGPVVSCNKGLLIASGDYIYPCSMDDVTDCNFFYDTVNYLNKYPQASFCYTIPGTIDRNKIYSDTFPLIKKYFSNKSKFFSPAEFTEISKKYAISLDTHSSIFKKQLLEDVNYFDPNLYWYCDWYLIMYGAFKYGFCYVPKSYSFQRMIDNSYSSKVDMKVEKVTLKYMIEKISKFEAKLKDRYVRSNVLSIFGKEIIFAIHSSEEIIFDTPSLRRKIMLLNLKKILKKILLNLPINFLSFFKKVRKINF